MSIWWRRGESNPITDFQINCDAIICSFGAVFVLHFV